MCIRWGKTVPLNSLVLAAPSKKGEEHMSIILALGGAGCPKQSRPARNTSPIPSQLGTHSRRWREGEDKEAKIRLVELFPSLTEVGQTFKCERPTGNTYTLAKDRWCTDQPTPPKYTSNHQTHPNPPKIKCKWSNLGCEQKGDKSTDSHLWSWARNPKFKLSGILHPLISFLKLRSCTRV